MHKLSEKILTADYRKFLREIKEKIISARIHAYRGLNRELIKLYWSIGKTIVDRQERYGWGESVVERISKDLIKEFKGDNGYSPNNLWRMRSFYLTYRGNLKLAQLVQEIPWGQNIVVMQRVKSMEIKEYYIKATIKYGWSRDVLIHQIEAEAHKKDTIKKMHNFPKTLPIHLAEQANTALKDSHVLDFLDVAEPLLEREMERGLLNNLKDFITELGLGFCFIGNQYPLKLKDKEYYIDLLFFHRHLHCLVAIELLCGAPHNNFCVALSVMWRSADMHESYHNLYNNGDKTGHHIINRIREPVRNSSNLDRFVGEPFFLFDALRKEQGLSLSFRDRFQHKCWLC